MIDILLTRPRDRRAAKRFFRKALKHQGQAPWQLITDKLRSYPAAPGNSSLPWSIEQANTKTIGLKSPINTLVNKSGKCEGSNQWHRLSVFSQFTVRSRTCFESVGTTSKQFTIDFSGTERSLTVERRRASVERL